LNPISTVPSLSFEIVNEEIEYPHFDFLGC